MEREKLARLIWKLSKKRNYYKYWLKYEQTSNNAWTKHFDEFGREKTSKEDE